MRKGQENKKEIESSFFVDFRMLAILILIENLTFSLLFASINVKISGVRFLDSFFRLHFSLLASITYLRGFYAFMFAKVKQVWGF